MLELEELVHVKMPNFTAETNMFTAWCKKMILINIANFALHDNCEGGEFFYNLYV